MFTTEVEHIEKDKKKKKNTLSGFFVSFRRWTEPRARVNYGGRVGARDCQEWVCTLAVSFEWLLCAVRARKLSLSFGLNPSFVSRELSK